MVITFNQLGKFGRRCNAHFQIAAVIAHAKRMGEDFAFPLWEHRNDYSLTNCWHSKLPKLRDTSEKAYHYTELPNVGNCNLHGYFQSYKYFQHYEDFIREKLTPKDNKNYPLLTGVCSIHVRRTDYLKFKDYHTNLGMDYYTEAMAKVGTNKFLVFSDDPIWCKETFRQFSNAIVSEKAADLVDFNMQISCEHHIISNSTFSWWAAWLNPNPDKVIVAPRNWFGPKNKHNDTKDLLPKEWIVI